MKSGFKRVETNVVENGAVRLEAGRAREKTLIPVSRVTSTKATPSLPRTSNLRSNPPCVCRVCRVCVRTKRII